MLPYIAQKVFQVIIFVPLPNQNEKGYINSYVFHIKYLLVESFLRNTY